MMYYLTYNFSPIFGVFISFVPLMVKKKTKNLKKSEQNPISFFYVVLNSGGVFIINLIYKYIVFVKIIETTSFMPFSCVWWLISCVVKTSVYRLWLI